MVSKQSSSWIWLGSNQFCASIVLSKYFRSLYNTRLHDMITTIVYSPTSLFLFFRFLATIIVKKKAMYFLFCPIIRLQKWDKFCLFIAGSNFLTFNRKIFITVYLFWSYCLHDTNTLLFLYNYKRSTQKLFFLICSFICWNPYPSYAIHSKFRLLRN